ncbi:MAG TPA: hypothetical protein VHL34_08110 [Rhizomicrobium sp.]|nr:hypothetical protein [Rhizomicrobium sp.]
MAEGPQNAHFRRSLMWGCVLPVVLALLLGGGWLAYNTYYYTSGYKEAPGLPTVMSAVQASPTATAMLGSGIQITRMELNMPGGPRKGGQRYFYKMRVAGAKASGEVQASVLIDKTQTEITDLRLIDSEDTPHNLMTEIGPKP